MMPLKITDILRASDKDSRRTSKHTSSTQGDGGLWARTYVDEAGGFSEEGEIGFCAGGVCGTGFAAAAFPTVKYLRILSRRFAPSPRIASKSSTLLKEPYDFRICKILPAVTGPIPGTCCSCSDVAVLRFTGFSGGFFLVPNESDGSNKPRIRMERRYPAENGREAIAVL